MFSLYAQTGFALLLMPATCSGKIKYIPEVYFPSTELILIYGADPAFGSYEETNSIKKLSKYVGFLC